MNLFEAELGREYRIDCFVNISFKKTEQWRKSGLVERVKIIVKEKTSYDFILFDVILHNGELLKYAVSLEDAKNIRIEPAYV